MFKWRAQSLYTPGTVAYKGNEQVTARIKALSGGRLDIQMFPAGALVTSGEIFNALGKGTFEVGMEAATFASGIDAGLAALTLLLNVWDEPRETKIWLYSLGGNDIYKKTYAKYNIQYVAPNFTGIESFMSKRPIRSLNDFQGMKLRAAPGLVAGLFQKLGAVPVNVPTGEIYQSLNTGVIDGTEFISITGNYDTGLHEVAKNILFPSFHTNSWNSTWSVNMDAWKKLPDDLKLIFETATYWGDWYFDYAAEGGDWDALQKMIAKGVTWTQLSAADMAKAKELGFQVADEWRAKSPLANEVITSIFNYKKAQGELPANIKL